MDKKNETVTISKEEYDSLVEDSLFLECLQGAGVDNWEGYDAAIEMMNEREELRKTKMKDINWHTGTIWILKICCIVTLIMTSWQRLM